MHIDGVPAPVLDLYRLALERSKFLVGHASFRTIQETEVENLVQLDPRGQGEANGIAIGDSPRNGLDNRKLTLLCIAGASESEQENRS